MPRPSAGPALASRSRAVGSDPRGSAGHRSESWHGGGRAGPASGEEENGVRAGGVAPCRSWRRGAGRRPRSGEAASATHRSRGGRHRRGVVRPGDGAAEREVEEELEAAGIDGRWRAACHGWRGEPEVRERGERKEEAGAGAWRREDAAREGMREGIEWWSVVCV